VKDVGVYCLLLTQLINIALTGCHFVYISAKFNMVQNIASSAL